jgi:hypothetical protein
VEFGLYQDGGEEPHEPPMYQSSFQRVLFGDPAFLVWRERAASSHRVTAKPVEGGLEVAIRWTRPAEDPFLWDPWREERALRELGRIYERIELEDELAAAPRLAKVEAWTRKGEERTRLEVEPQLLLERTPGGKSVLHLALRGPRERMCPLGYELRPDEIGAELELRFSGATTR